MVGVDDAVGVVAAAVGGGGGGDGGAGGCWWCSLMSSLLSVLLFLLAFAVVVAGAGDAGASAIVRGVPPSSTVRFVRLCRLGRGSRSPLFLFNVFRGEAVVCLLARLAAPGAGETQETEDHTTATMQATYAHCPHGNPFGMSTRKIPHLGQIIDDSYDDSYLII